MYPAKAGGLLMCPSACVEVKRQWIAHVALPKVGVG